MITLTYHAILDENNELLPGNLVVSPLQLERQILHLRKFHFFPNPCEVISCILENNVGPKNSVILTFDDAHLGQAKYAAKILEKYDIKGFFFAPTGIVNDRILPTVERQRLLQYSNIDYSKFYDQFCRMLLEYCPELSSNKYLPTEANISSALDYYAEYKFYSPLERLYRKVRENYIASSIFDTIISEMFKQRFCEDEILEKYYMSWEDLIVLNEKGHEIGGHGHNHLLETSVNSETAISDVIKAISLLEEKIGPFPRAYAYPYGIFKNETENYLKEAGIQIAFTCRSGLGIDENRLRIDRLDCKAFPFEINSAPNSWSVNELLAS